MFSPNEVIDIAVRMERNGETVYRQAAARVPDPEVVEMLEWMAGEEARHARWFADLKSGLEGGTRLPFTEKFNRVFLNDMLDGQSFSLKTVDFAAVDTVGQLAELFIEFEHDTILFYEMLCAFAAPETQRQLAAIIEEEKRHVAQLERTVGHSASLTAVGGPA